jgi:hypothetical protein
VEISRNARLQRGHSLRCYLTRCIAVWLQAIKALVINELTSARW